MAELAVTLAKLIAIIGRRVADSGRLNQESQEERAIGIVRHEGDVQRAATCRGKLDRRC